MLRGYFDDTYELSEATLQNSFSKDAKCFVVANSGYKGISCSN